MLMQAKEIELKVGELTNRGDYGRGIARIDMKTMKAIGVREGDVIEIEGGRKTPAIAVRAYPADVGLNIIRIDGLVRRNAKTSIGEYVKVRRAEPKEAKRVVFAPAEKGIVLHVSPNLIKQNMYLRPVRKGDIVMANPVFKRREDSIFEEFFGDVFLSFGLETKLVVVSTQPDGIVQITENTEVEVLPQAVEVKEVQVPTVTYEDIGGLKEEIRKVREMIELPLRHPELFERLGIEPPKGVLLYGPPGTGKTLLAKAVANEAGAHFIYVAGPEIMCIDPETPVLKGDKVVFAKNFLKERGERLIEGRNFRCYSLQSKVKALSNPSFSLVDSKATEVTEVEVPHFYLVNFENGKYVTSSNHPFLVLTKNGEISFKTPAFLETGDHAIVAVIDPEDPEIGFSKGRIKVKRLTPSLSFLLGMIAGDGSVGKDCITFCSKDEKLHELFRNLIREVFGIEKIKEYADEKGNKRSVVYSRDLVEFFEFMGFKKGKKDYREFLKKWLLRASRESVISFVKGLLITDGTTRKYSLIIYSTDKKALEMLKSILFSRGISSTLQKHKNKLSEMYKLVIRGKYNLENLKKAGFELKKIEIPKRSFEHVPKQIMKKLKQIMKNHGIAYGRDCSIEPYLNLRKKPTIFTIEKILEKIKTLEENLSEEERAFVSLLEKFVKGKILFDPFLKAEMVNEKRTLIDIGTLHGTFVTGLGHVMHNSKWYGGSEENLRKIFEEAEKNAPAIIFFDEIDAIAPKREDVSGEVERRVVAQLLSLMDGLKSRGKVIVIAATNRPNAIDPALRRPGRFDREIEIGVPNKNGRKEILQIHTRSIPIEIYDVTNPSAISHVISKLVKLGRSAREILSELKRIKEEKLREEINRLHKEMERNQALEEIVSRIAQEKIKTKEQLIELAESWIKTGEEIEKIEKEVKKLVSQIEKEKDEEKKRELMKSVQELISSLSPSTKNSIENAIKDALLEELAERTHGFVGADLAALCKEAAMHALRRVLPDIWKLEKDEPIPKEILERLKVTKEDFEYALKVVQPSAMREVLIEIPNVKWEDVGDLEEVKEALKEAVEWPLKYRESFERLGIKPPKGILLYGPPGCGKTHVVKALANESGANFISIKAGEILSKWFGESEQRIREIFRKARQVAPCIIFFDEIDAIAPRRGAFAGETHATERIVSQLLTEMSGLEELKDVVVIAATNRPDILDPALLRPGRFDKLIFVPPPDEKGRLEILKVHTKRVPLAKDVDLEKIAKRTQGYSGADLEALCREAALFALREDINAKEVKMKHFEKALEKIKPSLSKELIEAYRKIAEGLKKAKIEEKEEKKINYIG